MTITATVIADSISPGGKRITTLQLRYPKFIHGEFMTHRVFSRNASSSRAIPVQRLIQDVMTDPAMPIHWGKNQTGMQAHEENDALVRCYVPETYSLSDKTMTVGVKYQSPKEAWLNARDLAVIAAKAYDTAGYHKQVVNRVLEPFCHINVVVTATEWDNFFALRCHTDAQPEMNALANRMHLAMEQSTPSELKPGQWHLPYVLDEGYATRDAIRMSVARCARVSYLTHDQKPPKIEDDLKLYYRLASAVPIHASPLEHVATPGDDSRLYGNLVGWHQYRRMVELGLIPVEFKRDA
jgi:thymidylate synthase ThyX